MTKKKSKKNSKSVFNLSPCRMKKTYDRLKKKKLKMSQKNLKQKQQRKFVYLFKMGKNNFIDEKNKQTQVRVS